MASGVQRQLAYGLLPHVNVASQPPSTGATMFPAARAAAHMVIPRARDWAVCVPAAIMARLLGKIAAAPAPAMIMPVHSTRTRVPVDELRPGVSSATPSPAASMAEPMIISRLRPNRSPSTPHESSSRVTGTRKAAEIQVSWEDEVPRSFWNRPWSTAGMAIATWATKTASTAAPRVPRVSRCSVPA
jgi:hypothetical protein